MGGCFVILVTVVDGRMIEEDLEFVEELVDVLRALPGVDWKSFAGC